MPGLRLSRRQPHCFLEPSGRFILKACLFVHRRQPDLGFSICGREAKRAIQAVESISGTLQREVSQARASISLCRSVAPLQNFPKCRRRLWKLARLSQGHRVPEQNGSLSFVFYRSLCRDWRGASRLQALFRFRQSTLRKEEGRVPKQHLPIVVNRFRVLPVRRQQTR